ncbi:RNA polymerase II C-terminal domain kinase beta subunit [Coemansia brasiliensis]|uniref:RNA polymerase II C-terminal domain kinase beta subunit n=1 Tax=Coemansia brasiliensis TaxID=2650707 RepID=A0A9W8M1U4_9FUNG|nr:RNA polymerase II C-terminal domain kinase beta subunit [Coemansia brasiliensis]
MTSNSRRTYMTRDAIASRLFHTEAPSDLFNHPSMVSAMKSCILVKKVGRSLGFPCRTISTAQLLVHRVHIFQPSASFSKYSSSDLGAACLLVAAKMEETIKKLRDILTHSYLLFTKSEDSEFEPQSVPTSVTDKMRASVLSAEQFILDAIGFDFRTTHPHLLYTKLAKMSGVSNQIALSGWLILSDTFFTTLPIQYPAVVMAAGSLALAWNLELEPKGTSRFVIRALASHSSDSRHTSPHRSHNGRDSRSSRNPYNAGRNGSAGTSRKLPRKRPMQSLDMAINWWTDFGVATEDMQGFVRQIVDFYLLFFNSAMAPPEYMERHKMGLPSKEMSQRINQWRMNLVPLFSTK